MDKNWIKEISKFGWGTEYGHDSTIIKDHTDDTYYMFSTDTVLNSGYTSGVQIRQSIGIMLGPR